MDAVVDFENHLLASGLGSSGMLTVCSNDAVDALKGVARFASNGSNSRRVALDDAGAGVLFERWSDLNGHMLARHRDSARESGSVLDAVCKGAGLSVSIELTRLAGRRDVAVTPRDEYERLSCKGIT